MSEIVREGDSSYGHCWIEGDGVSFWVFVMDGQSRYGPYSSLTAAMDEFRKWCI